MASRKHHRPVRTPPGLYRRLADLMTRRIPVVVVTVYEASGSAPGKAGARMLVTADALHGTVGGGRVENAAIERARDLLGSEEGPRTERIDVVQDLGMSCGGSMRLLYEPMTPPPRLVIFGAGHVAEPLCAAAALAGFDVTVCDDREDWLTTDRFPAARDLILGPFAEAVGRAGIDPQTFVASVTPGHAFDLEIVARIVEDGLKPRYLGVIGSRRKSVELRKDLVERGVDPRAAERLRIPMGLDIGAAEPREIAVSIVAEMIAVVRGVETAEPW